jgi:hypothetical protein
MANMATIWALQGITIDVRTFTSLPLRANAPWTLWNLPPQLTNTTIVIHKQIDHGRQQHDQCIKKSHPEVPFAQVGYDTIVALTQLAEVFKNNFQKVKAPQLSTSPIKAAENKSPAALTQHISSSPMKHKYHTRSQAVVNMGGAPNTPSLQRVVTPMTSQAASLRVPTRSQIFPPEICHKMILEHGNNKHGRCLGNESLVPTTSCKRSGKSSNGQENGVHGPHE